MQLFFNQSDSRYWRYDGRCDVSDLTAERCKAIGDSYRSAGISIHSLGVYTNLIHPDEQERKANPADSPKCGNVGKQTRSANAGESDNLDTLPPSKTALPVP